MSLQVQRGAGEIRPKAIKELYEEGAAALAQQVPVAELKKYKAKAKKLDSFSSVWDTRGTGARHRVKVWAPDVSIGRNSGQLCLGHYAVAGNYDKPTSGVGQSDFLFRSCCDSGA